MHLFPSRRVWSVHPPGGIFFFGAFPVSSELLRTRFLSTAGRQKGERMMSAEKVIMIIRDVLTEMDNKMEMRLHNHTITLWCVIFIALLALAFAVVAFYLTLCTNKTGAECYQHNNRVHLSAPLLENLNFCGQRPYLEKGGGV